MDVIDHEGQPLEEWRPGMTTRMRVSALTGAAQLAVFEQWCAERTGAPTHRHPVEEVLTVISGEAEIRLDDECVTVAAGQSVVVPAGRPHAFRNIGRGVLHLQFTLAAPIFEASYEGRDETSRRWAPEAAQGG